MNEIKILPWVPTQSQHARNVFTGGILVFMFWVLALELNKLVTFWFHLVLVL